MNIVVLTGRLTADPNVRCTQSGQSVAMFDIAVNDGYGENKKTYFHRIIVWGKSADSCGNCLHKGSRVNVKGKLTSRTYEKDGVKHYVTEVVADSYGGVEFLDPKGQGATANPMEDEEVPF